MSLFTDNSSANRGACKQTCRREYKLIDMESGDELRVENNYVMSPKDLCCIDFLDRVLDAGVSVLKIEGRGRSADYVYKVARAYREASDSVIDGTYNKEKIKSWLKDLKSVYNRGLSSGWYLGRPIPEMTDSYGSKATEEKIYVGRIKKYYPKAKVAEALTEALGGKGTESLLNMELAPFRFMYDLHIQQALCMGKGTGADLQTHSRTQLGPKESPRHGPHPTPCPQPQPSHPPGTSSGIPAGRRPRNRFRRAEQSVAGHPPTAHDRRHGPQPGTTRHRHSGRPDCHSRVVAAASALHRVLHRDTTRRANRPPLDRR